MLIALFFIPIIIDVNLAILDRLSGKIKRATVKEDRLCVASTWEYYMGFGGRCYPMTPSRYSNLVSIAKPTAEGLLVSGYVLPDTIRLIHSYVVIYHPKGGEVHEVLYDLREDAVGISKDNAFLRLEGFDSLKCIDAYIYKVCVGFGALLTLPEEKMAKYVALMTEEEYRKYLEAVQLRDPSPWELLVERVRLYEVFISQVIQELSRLGELRLAEYINAIATNFRRIQETVAPPRPPQQQQKG